MTHTFNGNGARREPAHNAVDSSDNASAKLPIRERMFSRVLFGLIAWIGTPLAVLVVGVAWMKSNGYLDQNEKSVAVGEVFSSILIVAVAIGVVLLVPRLIAFWPLRFLCPYCGKALRSDHHWRCGRCGHDNEPNVFFFATVASICAECHNKPHTLQCPHCRREVDLVEQPDRRHAAIFMGVKAIVPPPMPTGETAGEEEARLRLAVQNHQHALVMLGRETELLEAQVKRAVVEAKLKRFTEPKDESQAAIAGLMREIEGAFMRAALLAQFRKLKEMEIVANPQLSEPEKSQQLFELEDLIQEARAKYL